MPTQTPLPIALIGCGGITWVHTRAMNLRPDLVKCVAVCDVDPAKAEIRAREVQAPVRTWDDILKDPAIAAVDICLPHHLHKARAIEALDAGKHVLIEKPLANTLEEADAMIAAAERNKRLLMVAQCARYEPEALYIKEQLEKATIGQLTMARADHQQNVHLPAGHWLADPKQAGGGVIIGSGVHRIDLLRFYCGDIAEVYCMMRPVAGRLDEKMETAAVIAVRHTSGVISELAFHWGCINQPWYELLVLYGTKGQIHNVGGVHIATSLEPGPGAFARHWVNPFGNGFDGEMVHFAECIRDGRTPSSDARDNRKTLAAVLACYESARTNQPVRPA